MAWNSTDAKFTCRNCEKRYLGCHDHCEEYQKQVKKRKEQKRQIDSLKKVDSEWIRYKCSYFDKGDV